ncbi:MAG: hypothetical protein V4568_11675 [Pseudomonadota bacterium]
MNAIPIISSWMLEAKRAINALMKNVTANIEAKTREVPAMGKTAEISSGSFIYNADFLLFNRNCGCHSWTATYLAMFTAWTVSLIARVTDPGLGSGHDT